MILTVVCDVLGKENNGTTIAAYNLIRSMRKKGHTVRIVCPDADKRGQKDYYIIPTYNFGPFNGYVKKNGVSLGKPNQKILEKAIDGADVVHVMIPFSVGRTARKIAEKKGIPVTAGFHCQAENFTNHFFLMNTKVANVLTYRFFYRHLYQYCAAVHYPTQFICDLFEKVTGPTNHYVISNGVSKDFVKKEVKRPASLEEKYVILFTGRYSKEKSHYLLPEAVSKSKYKDQIQLIFAGDGPQKENLKAMSQKLGIAMPIMKFFSRQEMVSVINMADLYCHPAEIEIEAISCLEALACGKVPVINNSKRSATRFFALDKKNLFHYNDSSSLAERIDFWITHEELKKAYEKRYLEFAKQFDFDECMDKMEQMLLEVTKDYER